MKKLSVLFSIFIFVFFANPVYAQIGQAAISPSSPLYFLKSVREILELKFAGTTKVRALRQLEFSVRRIREVNSLVGTPNEDLIEPALEKYAWHLQELKGLVHPKDISMVNKVDENITLELNSLQEVFEKVKNPKAKRAIRLAIFRISEKYTVSRPQSCDFLVKEASSSALNNVEKSVYQERAIKCLQTKE